MKSNILSISRDVKDLCKSCDYLESNFRNLLARRLRQTGLEVYEEVPVVYTFDTDPIPFGHGFMDIVIFDRSQNGYIILELKITTKDARRQLKKYMRHFKYGNILYGVCINFTRDDIEFNEVRTA